MVRQPDDFFLGLTPFSRFTLFWSDPNFVYGGGGSIFFCEYESGLVTSGCFSTDPGILFNSGTEYFTDSITLARFMHSDRNLLWLSDPDPEL